MVAGISRGGATRLPGASGAAVAVLAFVMVAILPGANAFQLEVTSWDDTPITPETEVRTVTLALTKSCQELLLRDPAYPTSTVRVDVDADPQIVMNGPTNTVIGCDHGDETATATVRFDVAVSRKATGLTPMPITFSASMPEAPLDENTATDPVTIEATAAPYVLFQAKAVEKLKGGHGSVPFLLAFDNLGNTPLTFTFSLLDEPDQDDWTMALPDPFLLGTPTSTEGADDSGLATATARAPAGPNAQGAWRILVMGTAEDGTSEEQPLNVILRRTWDADTQGAPAPALPLTLAALALTLGLARRRG